MLKKELHKNWFFRQKGTAKWFPAKVPGTVHTDLLRAGLMDDPFYRDNESKVQWVGKTDWEYQTRFSLPAEIFRHEQIELVFKGLDTYASVFLNDHLLLQANNMFREWRIPCKNFLLKGENVLLVHFRSPINEVLPRMQQLDYQLPAINDHGEKTSPYTRKAPYHYGWDWGPRLVTCGIWQPVYLQAWSTAKIRDFHIVQKSLDNSKAEITVYLEIYATQETRVTIGITSPEGAFNPVKKELNLTSGLNGCSLEVTLQRPQFWWPNGYGAQPLYTIQMTLIHKGHLLDQARQRIGMRTSELRQEKDAFGKSFEFVINGIPIFAKGGNWIPADSFVTRVDSHKYEYLLRSVKEANMNMLRVWGGGIYEQDIFYDLCDEYGIMIWQDFMFACSLYPATPEDLSNIEQEAIYQVKRLRHHPGLVLWCGNNEVEAAWESWGWKNQLPAQLWEDYRQIFHKLLPGVCQKYDPSRPYWPSSPSSNLEAPPNSQFSGDVHYWEVWHGERPFRDYLNQKPRFMSEYGFQSFPHISSLHKFTLREDHDLESPVMLVHQKQPQGNQVIRRYLLKEYGEPRDFKSFLYLSQILQAEGVKFATEHLRRIRPRCMGALYWQINDCWPVASWSSIDYYGQWKALHYYARKFFQPVLVSALDENNKIQVYVVSDLLTEQTMRLKLSLMNFQGDVIRQISQNIQVPALSSSIYYTLDKQSWLSGCDPSSLLLFLELKNNNQVVSSNYLFFQPTKYLKLPEPEITPEVEPIEDGLRISLRSLRFAMNVFLEVDQYEGFFSDNFFHLLPERTMEVEFKTRQVPDSQTFQESLRIVSLVDFLPENSNRYLTGRAIPK